VEGNIVGVAEILVNALFVVVAIVVVYGLWGWKRGKVQRKSTKTALVFGLVAVVALFVSMTLMDFVVAPASDKSVGGFVAFMVAMLLVGVGLIAFAGAVVSLLVRLIKRQGAETAITAPPIGAQRPRV
jgi:membrane-associated HD superfamily phosphohydrolase